MNHDELIANHEPHGLRPLLQHYLKDVIYGANDGIITTFAIVSGVAGASLSNRIVIILGLANLLADGFSMGASSFLSIRSDESVRAASGEDPIEPFPFRHGAVTFAAFVIAGSVPLLSYFFDLGDSQFAISVAMTALTLFVVGAARALVTDKGWIAQGREMLLIGTAAAAVSYGVGYWLAGLTA